jgi:hypothetical protein
MTPTIDPEIIAGGLSFPASKAQREAKEAYWARNPDSGEVTLDQAMASVPEPRLARWWQDPEFRAWFRQEKEFQERAAVLAHMTLDVLEEALLNPQLKMSDRLAAGRLAVELARKMPGKAEAPKAADDFIGKMDRKQLEAYLTKNKHLVPGAVLTNNPTDASLDESNRDSKSEK